MPKTRVEWITIIGGLISIFLVLVYCGWRIQMTSEWLSDHRAYIRARDVEWEAYMVRAEKRQVDILNQIEGHLTRQDGHMARQDEEAVTILKNQGVIIDHIKREEAIWHKVKP